MATQMTDVVLQLDGVTLTAKLGGTPVAALRDLTLSIGRGRVLGVVGESGAGKSQADQISQRRAEFLSRAEQVALLGILTEQQAEQVKAAVKRS